MAVTLSITVTDEQAARAQVAFGRFDNTTSPVWIPATRAEMQDAITSWIKGRVLEYETALAAQAKRTEIGAEIWTSLGVSPLPNTRR